MSHPTAPPRRWRRLLALPIAAALLGLAACASASPTPGGTSAPGTPAGPVTLRISTWGSDSRTRMTEQAIDLFEAANPDIKVTLENAQFSGYWDRLATQVAAGDAPDVIQLDEANFSAYAGRRVLADLAPYADTLKLSELAEGSRATGRYRDTQFGVPMGLTTLAVAANTKLFEKAGVPLPDDTSWTWDDYASLGAQLTAKLGGNAYGVNAMGLTAAELILWARQNGEEVFAGEGQKPLSEATVLSYFQRAKALASEKAAPGVTLQIESSGGPLDASLLGTNRAALALTHTAQVASYSRAADTDLRLLRAPGVEPGKHAMANAASQWTIYARGKHPEAAAKLIAFITGDTKAAEILTTERGIPALPSVRKHIEPFVDSAAKVGLDFANAVDAELVAPSPAAPAKASSFASDFTLVGTDVMFARVTEDEGARRVIALIKGYGA